MKYEKEHRKNYMEEAKELMDKGEPYRLLHDLNAYCGELPISAQTYVTTFTEDSADAMAIPFRKGKDLVFFQNIRVPILGVISDNEDGEYTIIPIKEAVELLKAENKLAEAYIIEGTDHVFTGKEKELVDIVTGFIKRRILM